MILLNTISFRCPFGAPLISSLIRHHAECNDFQTVAMLVCALTTPTAPRAEQAASRPGQQRPPGPGAADKFWFLKAGSSAAAAATDSPYHTVHSVHGGLGPGLRSTPGSDTKLDSVLRKTARSNSWTEVAQDEAAVTAAQGKEGDCSRLGEVRWGLLEPDTQADLYQSSLAAYRELLHSWGLLQQRTAVAKHGPGPQPEDACVGATSCPRRVCAVCRRHVAGLSLACPACGHGGHYSHLTQWFSTHQHCPAGCDCQCKMYY